MQDMNLFYQQNMFDVNPVYSWQWGLFADGKILHCESLDIL